MMIATCKLYWSRLIQNVQNIIFFFNQIQFTELKSKTLFFNLLLPLCYNYDMTNALPMILHCQWPLDSWQLIWELFQDIGKQIQRESLSAQLQIPVLLLSW